MILVRQGKKGLIRGMRLTNSIRAGLFCAALIALLTPTLAVAGKLNKLSESDIKSFIVETTKITSGQAIYRSNDEIRNYLDRHLHKKGFFKSKIRYIVPGFPSQENTLSLDKEQFIESILSGQQALENYYSEVDVKKVRISKDKTKATVVTKSKESGVMPVPGEGGKAEKIPVEGKSTCDQILKLEDGVIQMYSATCETDINFQMPF